MVMVYCEGPTEWYVIRKLWAYNVLNGAGLIQLDDADPHIINNPRSINTQFLNNLPTTWDKFLLVYDQEHYPTPQDWINQNLAHLGTWRMSGHHNNVFCIRHNGKLIYAHINNVPSPNGYKDFDGYLLNLFKIVGSNAAQALFNRLPAYIRNATNSPNIHSTIHQMGIQDIPNLMSGNGFPIQRSKGLIYAYITSLQLSKSHVWFSENLVDTLLQMGYANQVAQAFQTIIDAWNNLINGVCP